MLGRLLVDCVLPQPSPSDEDEGVRLVEELGLLRCRAETSLQADCTGKRRTLLERARWEDVRRSLTEEG